jgi:hypothetical protein
VKQHQTLNMDKNKNNIPTRVYLEVQRKTFWKITIFIYLTYTPLKRSLGVHVSPGGLQSTPEEPVYTLSQLKEYFSFIYKLMK